MHPPFLRSPYTSVLTVAYAAWVVPEVADALRRDDDGPDLDANSRSVLYAAIGVAVGTAIGLGFLAPAWATLGALAVPAFWIGVLLMLVGVALRWYSVGVLGDAFARSVTVSGSQGVVDTGPYAVVRHPSYAGSLLTFVGLALALGTWPGLVVCPPVAGLGYAYRIGVEERALRRELDGYDEYCERTPHRLVPGVY
ncbi:MAG: methyltransferase [Haloferacaceae archaeon]